jgi:hypothetical protein
MAFSNVNKGCAANYPLTEVSPEGLAEAAKALWVVMHPQIHPQQGLENQMASTAKMYEGMAQHVINAAFHDCDLSPPGWIVSLRAEVAALRARLTQVGAEHADIPATPVPAALLAEPESAPLASSPLAPDASLAPGPCKAEQLPAGPSWSPLDLNPDVHV